MQIFLNKFANIFSRILSVVAFNTLIEFHGDKNHIQMKLIKIDILLCYI